VELLDRAYQRELLVHLAEEYPTLLPVAHFFGETDVRRRDYNLAYLEEHDLVACKWAQSTRSRKQAIAAQITARGIDFITDDGGLTAILGIVTVKLHEETIRTLLINRIEKADGDKTTKDLLVAKIRTLPADALGAAAMAALDEGLRQAPQLFNLLRSVLHI